LAVRKYLTKSLDKPLPEPDPSSEEQCALTTLCADLEAARSESDIVGNAIQGAGLDDAITEPVPSKRQRQGAPTPCHS
jgi:hypothetical protein